MKYIARLVIRMSVEIELEADEYLDAKAQAHSVLDEVDCTEFEENDRFVDWVRESKPPTTGGFLAARGCLVPVD